MNLKPIFKWIETAAPDLKKTKVPTDKQKQLLKTIVNEEVQELHQGIENDNKQEILDAIIDILWVSLNVAVAYNITSVQLEEMASMIKDSNYSKFCTYECEAKDTVKAYATGTHTDKPGERIITHYEKHGDYYIIKRSHDGKIMKNLHYVSVDDMK